MSEDRKGFVRHDRRGLHLFDYVRHALIRMLAGSDLVVLNTEMKDGELLICGNQGVYVGRSCDLRLRVHYDRPVWWAE